MSMQTPEEIIKAHKGAEEKALPMHFTFNEAVFFMIKYAQLIADKAYDACWTNTAEGWNGETQPLCYMPDKHVDSYERQKEQFLNSINELPTNNL